MNYNLLVDWKDDYNFFLQRELLKKVDCNCKIFDIPNYTNRDRVSRIRAINLYFKYVQLAYRAVIGTAEGETLICWNFTTSIAVGYLCKVLNKKRTIIALNIIAHPRNAFSNKLRKLIFNPVMSLPDYYITVNSNTYIKEYSQRFNVPDKKFYVLNDPIQSIEEHNFIAIDSYVFAGGEAKRDWKTFFKACEQLPDINFLCVIRKKFFDDNLKAPKNVELHFDVDQDIFYELMQNSSIVVIPLESQLPSGLIILLKAATYKKAIIATNTPSTRNYIEHNKSGLLVEQGDYKTLAQHIDLLYKNKSLQDKYATNLLEHIHNNYSHENYTKKLVEIIDNIINVNA